MNIQIFQDKKEDSFDKPTCTHTHTDTDTHTHRHTHTHTHTHTDTHRHTHTPTHNLDFSVDYGAHPSALVYIQPLPGFVLRLLLCVYFQYINDIFDLSFNYFK